MFGVLFAEKGHRANYFIYFASIFVFNLNFNQSIFFFNYRSLLEDSVFSHKAELIKLKVVLCEKLIKQ